MEKYRERREKSIVEKEDELPTCMRHVIMSDAPVAKQWALRWKIIQKINIKNRRKNPLSLSHTHACLLQLCAEGEGERKLKNAIDWFNKIIVDFCSHLLIYMQIGSLLECRWMWESVLPPFYIISMECHAREFTIKWWPNWHPQWFF